MSLWSYNHGIPRYSAFLDALEQDLLMKADGLATGFWLFGGFEEAERVVAAFAEEEPEHSAFPVAAVAVRPSNARFPGDLTHRDYLGALMGLGIERDRIGDINVGKEVSYIFCLTDIAQFIADNLTSVGRTTVKCELSDIAGLSARPVEFEDICVPLASERVDAAVARLAKVSRNGAAELLAQAKVFLNRRQCENGAAKLKEGDILSIRGIGKFKYDGIAYTGKKGKEHALFKKYI